MTAGTFHILEMEQWDEDYVNMEGQAYIRFEADGTGEFRFGVVQASLDWRSGTRDGRPAVEFSWEGSAECDPATGRGWAILEAPDTLKGTIFFHMGDESGFAARRAQ